MRLAGRHQHTRRRVLRGTRCCSSPTYNCAMKPRILVFAKHPQAGKVKTRLAHHLGAEEASFVYRALVQDLMTILMQLTPLADIEIHLDAYSDFFFRFSLPQKLQVGQNLGEKMRHAIDGALREGTPAVAVLGSDPVGLGPEKVRALLDTPGDVVFGPATDGGFWAVLARRTHPELFDRVPWSVGDTLDVSVRSAQRCGLSVGFGGDCQDLDTLGDLLRIREAVQGGSGVVGEHLAGALLALEDRIQIVAETASEQSDSKLD